MPMTIRIARIITTTISSIRVNPSLPHRATVSTAVMSTGAILLLVSPRPTAGTRFRLYYVTQYRHGNREVFHPSGPPTRTWKGQEPYLV